MLYSWYCNHPKCKYSCFKSYKDTPKIVYTTYDLAEDAADRHANANEDHGVATYIVEKYPT